MEVELVVVVVKEVVKEVVWAENESIRQSCGKYQCMRKDYTFIQRVSYQSSISIRW